jgi:6-phosphofructokinase
MEMTPTGPVKVKWEDIVAEAGKDNNTLGKGEVFKNGINVVSTTPKPDPKSSDKEQYEFYSGTPFSLGDKRYIATENNTKQKAKYQEFNTLFSLEHDLNRNYDFAVIDSTPMMSMRIVDETTGQFKVVSVPATIDNDNVILLLPDGSNYKASKENIDKNPQVKEILSTYGLSKEIVYEMIEK